MPAECTDQRCLQDGGPCDYAPHGYTYCRADGEHHRPPECPVDEQGNAKPSWLDDPAPWEA